MATPNNQKSAFRLPEEAVKQVEQLLIAILEYHRRQNGIIRAKLEAIDIAYARHQTAKPTGHPDESGIDSRTTESNISCGITEKDITVPVVIGQVDSFVGYLADVYLSGYPMFPVVSEPQHMKEAEMLEAIIDTTSVLGRYHRHFLMSFRDGIKYNFMPMEISWEPLEQYDVVANFLNPQAAASLQQHQQHITKVKRLDPYNTVFDSRVDPVEVTYCGEFAGNLEIIPRLELKRFINRYSQSGDLYNLGKIHEISAMGPENFFYTDLPTVSDFITGARAKNAQFDWAAWLGTRPAATGMKRTLQAGAYEKFTCYCRIIPSELKITNVPKSNSPQIWKFIFLNGKHLIYAKPVYTVYDTLPIMIGQPLEDGFALQTKSIAEAQIPMQEAASTLFNIRFNAARRAVSDRALFDPTLINESDVNAPTPAAKIPVRLSGLNDKDFSRAYQAIPYDPRGTDTVIGDARNVLELSDQLSGLNRPQQGRFQKGNKSVREWEDTMSNADNRPRLPALAIEFQTMIPIKEQIKLNIFQHGVKGTFQSFKSGTPYEVKPQDMEKLKEVVLSFRVADGYTPKSKMASGEMIEMGLQAISQNQFLAQSFGAMLPAMFLHLMQLGGVRGMEQYLPQATQNAANGAVNQPPTNGTGSGNPNPVT